MTAFISRLKLNTMTVSCIFFGMLTLIIFSNVYGVEINGSEEYQVNTNISDDQSFPSVAAFSNGNFVVVWDSGAAYSEDIYAQIFDKQGSKIGKEILVNSHTSGSQGAPRVAVLSDDSFAVVWYSLDQDSSGWGVYLQIFDSSGDKINGEIRVNDYTSSHQYESRITALGNGKFLVTWISRYQDTSAYGVYGKIYDSSGNEIKGEFQINTYTAGNQRGPDAAYLSNGNFIVIWLSENQDTSGWGIYGKVFNSSGIEVIPEFIINTYVLGDQRNPSVTALTNGKFVVVWTGENQGDDIWGIYGQLFNNDGTKVEEEFRIDAASSNNYFKLGTVATLAEDNFIAVWINSDPNYSTGYKKISAQIFDSSGNKLGDKFQVNTSPTVFDYYPSAVKLKNDNFVIVWPARSLDDNTWDITCRIFNFVDDNPTASTIFKQGEYNKEISFSLADFINKFKSDRRSLVNIQITSLPNNGRLKFSGTDVILNQEIVADILNNLIFDPDTNWYGSNAFDWKGYDGVEYSNVASIIIIVDPPLSSNAPTANGIDKIGKYNTKIGFDLADFANKLKCINGRDLTKIQIRSLPDYGLLKLSGISVNLEQEIDANDINNLLFFPGINAGDTIFAWRGYDGNEYSNTAAVNLKILDKEKAISDNSNDSSWLENYGTEVAVAATVAVVTIPCIIYTGIVTSVVGGIIMYKYKNRKITPSS